MKVIVALAALVAVTLAAPPADRDRDAVILRYNSDNIGIDGYNYAYETSNGITQQETAQLQNPGTDNEAMAVRGQFSYLGPDGVTYTVTYYADGTGFHAEGAHIPK